MKRTAWTLVTLLALTCAANADVIWGLETTARAGGTIQNPDVAPTYLFNFASNGTAFNSIGVVKLAGTNILADGLAYTSSAGLLGFQLAGGASTLISINPVTAVATAIGGPIGGNIRGAAFNYSGQLFALDYSTNQVMQINPGTGALMSTWGISGLSLLTASDIAFGADGTAFIVNGNSIYSYDFGTTAATWLFTDNAILNGSSVSLVGAAFTQTGNLNTLFDMDINGGEDIVRYDTGGGFNRALVYGNIIPGSNAGRGDLASQPVPEPASLLLLTSGVGLLARRIRKSRKA